MIEGIENDVPCPLHPEETRALSFTSGSNVISQSGESAS
jgi:hypothetical protein